MLIRHMENLDLGLLLKVQNFSTNHGNIYIISESKILKLLKELNTALELI